MLTMTCFLSTTRAWMRAMNNDYTFQKVMENEKDLKDIDGFKSDSP